MRFYAGILLTSVSLLSAGCASIVNGQNQSVSVETRTEAGPLASANCQLSNNKGTWFVTTPGSTTVHRSYENLSVKCQKDSLEPGLVSVKSSTKGMAFGNILFGGLIGAGVDISTGAAYDYPTLITVVMGKSASQTAPVVAPSASAPSSAEVAAVAASAAQ
jgi:hypothetical protein